MSFNNVPITQIVLKQYRYKLRAYYQVFTSLVVMQLLALLFSSGGIMTSGGGSYGVNAHLNTYTGDLIIIFTFLWGFINAITITTKAYREDDFLFVTNRQSQHLSNMLFLATASVIGGLTATLAGYLLRVIIYWTSDEATFAGMIDDPTTFIDPLISIVTVALYVVMFCAFGYLIGNIIQLHRLFMVIIPVLVVGGLLFDPPITLKIYAFFVGETNILLFLLKTVVTTVFLFACSFVPLRQKEVRP
ncbi:hypothetical protein GCM10008983_02510 [Lentibacillus halophilus]|uniref:ABC-2 type transport system permease protein n=1 Tax=Lentibacillus halophilus TaxID=295065 RepID=A0ABP3IVU9_9BACI